MGQGWVGVGSARLASAVTPPPRYIAVLAWSFAKVRVASPAFMKLAGDAALPRLQKMNEQEVSNLLWAFGAAGVRHPVVEAAARLMAAEAAPMSAWSEQCISNSAWALARLRIADQRLLRVVDESMPPRLSEFSMHGLVNVVWSFAKLREQASFLPLLAPHLRERKRWAELSPIGTARLLWSITTLNQPGLEDLYMALAYWAVMPKAAEFKQQDVSNVLWAFGTARVNHPPLFSAMSKRAFRILPTFTTQSLTNIASALFKAKVPEGRLFAEAAAEGARRPVSDWTPLSLSTFVHTLAKVRRLNAGVLSLAEQSLKDRGPEYNDIDLSKMAVALSSFSPASGDEARRSALFLVHTLQAERAHGGRGEAEWR